MELLAKFNNIKNNINILYINNLIKSHPFIIFCNYVQFNFLNFNFKNNIFKENCISLILNKKYINMLFSDELKFLSSSIFCIFIDNITQFINIIKLLNNIKFFFSFNFRFSNLLTNNIVLNFYTKYSNYYLFHYNIFVILFNIILLLFYFILIMLKYINIKK